MNVKYSTNHSALPMIISFADKLNSFARTKLNKELNCHGLKFNQWRLINVISNNVIHTPAKLAEELMIERATVSRYLDQLEDRGCIERSHNQFDRRVVDIKLTLKGEEIAKLGIDVMDHAYSKLFSDLTKTENKHFIALITKLNKHIPEEFTSA